MPNTCCIIWLPFNFLLFNILSELSQSNHLGWLEYHLVVNDIVVDVLVSSWSIELLLHGMAAPRELSLARMMIVSGGHRHQLLLLLIQIHSGCVGPID